MNGIGRELERKLKTLRPGMAASVEKLVRDVMELADAEAEESAHDPGEAAIAAHREHWRRMDALFAELDWSEFERPPQGKFEKREEW
jgi:hypothetical protein